MNALSRLFASLRMSSPNRGNAHSSRRRRRAQRTDRLINGETLEPKQLLAVDLVNPFDDQTLETSAPVTIAITNQFDVTDVLGTVVKFETNAPVGSASGLSTNDFYVELYDKAGAAGTLTPETVGNFLSYVSDGSYDNTMIHRSVSDFVIQGGGFTAPSVAADQLNSDPISIPTKGTITNEPGNSNLRGTLAMAKLGGQPNSATSQWFVNLSDNTFLDSDNGGYAVFGEVLGDGMTVVDVMAGALTYDATTYYSNGAFSDLPLWNVNADNIVLPQDFVKVETITELSDESELMEYSVTTSDTSKLAASINAAGDLVLTPVAGQSGSVSVTVTATSKTDGSTKSDTFAVGLGAEEPQDTLLPIEDFGAIGLAKGSVSNDIYVTTADAETLVYSYTGQPLDANDFAGSYTIERAERVNGVNQLLLRYRDGKPWIWTMTEDWKYASNPASPTPKATSAFYAAEVDFTIDLDQDTVFGLAVESNGNTVLSSSSTTSSGRLFANGTPLTQGSTAITQDIYQAYGYTVVAAETVSGSNQVLLQHSTGKLWVWTMDADWKLQSAPPEVLRNGTAAFFNAETNFGVDANSDGFIGLPPLEVVEASGATTLHRTAADGKLFVNGNFVRLGSLHIDENVYASFGWTIIAAETNSGVNQLLVQHDAGRLWTWTMTADWNLQSVSVIAQTGTTAFFDAETSFLLDANNDGAIGLPALTPVESTGTTLSQDAAGKLYVDGNGVRVGLQHISADFYSAFGWTIVAAETVGDTNKLLLQRGLDAWVWTLDSAWLLTASSAIYRNGSTNFFVAESEFQIDINGDADIGSPTLTVVESDGYKTLMKDNAGGLYVDGRPLFMGDNATRITDDIYASYGYTVVGADLIRQSDNSFAPQLLLEHTNQSLWVWTMTTGWLASSFGSITSKIATGYRDIEAVFGYDGDKDGYRGIFYSSTGGITVTTDSLNRLYINGDAMRISSRPMTTDDPAFYGYEIIGAKIIDGENRLLLQKPTTRQLWLWTTDAAWAWSGIHSDIGTGESTTRGQELLSAFGIGAP